MFYERTVLPNGIRVLTEKISNVRSVSLGFWVKLGSRDEQYQTLGSTHFLEHVLFKGTKKRSSMDISEAFESLGAEFNAFSAKENTCFYSRLLDEHLSVGIDVISDMLLDSLLKKEDIEAERKVILEEIGMHEDAPDEQVHDIFVQTMWPRHPLGKPVIGTRDSILNMTHSSLIDIYNDGYTNDNIVVAAAGDIEHSTVLNMVESAFSDTTRQIGKIKRHEEIPKKISSVKVFPKQTEQAHLTLGYQAINAHSPKRFALFILDTILGGGMSSRLFQEIREKRSLVYSIYSSHALYAETGFVQVYAACNPKNIKTVTKKILDEIENIKANGITEAEYKRGQENIKGSLILSLESTSHRMGRLGKAEIIHGEILSLDEIIDRVNNVTIDDVNNLAKELFDNKKLVVSAIGPVDDSVFDFLEKQ